MTTYPVDTEVPSPSSRAILAPLALGKNGKAVKITPSWVKHEIVLLFEKQTTMLMIPKANLMTSIGRSPPLPLP